MECSISGEVTNDPVLSPKSNMIFDKKTLEVYISKYNKDPITNDPLALEEIIKIKQGPNYSVERSNKNYNSIPSLLSMFQNEWDSIILENFELKKKIKTLQDDLTSSVYHYDASIRVISRLTKERDEAVQKLQDVLLRKATGIELEAPIEKMDIDHNEELVQFDNEKDKAHENKVVADATVENNISLIEKAEDITEKKIDEDEKEVEEEKEEDIFAKITNAELFLSSIHKKQLKDFKSTLNVSKHTLSLKTLFPFIGFDNLNIPPSNQLIDSTCSLVLNHDLLLVSNKTYIFVLNLKAKSLSHKFRVSSIHKETITHMAFINVGEVSDPIFKPVIGFEDGQILIIDTDLSEIQAEDKISTAKTIEIPRHESGSTVVSLITHPSLNNHLIEIFSNGIWSMVDCHKMKLKHSSTIDSSINFEYSSADLHMDGTLLSIGTTSGSICIFDLKTGDKLTSFEENSDTSRSTEECVIDNVRFADNGYMLISTLTEISKKISRINIWDLRKGQIITTINSNVRIRALGLDRYSQILLVATSDNMVQCFKYVKKTKIWEHDSKVSGEIKKQMLIDGTSKNLGVTTVYWQRTFDRVFFILRTNGQWGKFAIDYS